MVLVDEPQPVGKSKSDHNLLFLTDGAERGNFRDKFEREAGVKQVGRGEGCCGVCVGIWRKT